MADQSAAGFPAAQPELSDDEFARWISPASALALLPENFDYEEKENALRRRLESGIVKVAAGIARLNFDGHERTFQNFLIPAAYFSRKWNKDYDHFWAMSELHFNNEQWSWKVSETYEIEDVQRIHTPATEVASFFNVRIEPDRLAATLGPKLRAGYAEKGERIASTAGGEAELKDWLLRAFQRDPDRLTSKPSFFNAAKTEFGERISARAFMRVWADLAPAAGRTRPGRKS